MVGGDVENARNTYSDTSRNQVILDIQNVSTSGSKVLKNVSLQIKSGEILVSLELKEMDKLILNMC
ncbi:hypothetical protein NWE57_02260 [Mycoplasmopsis cynos]|nr:hypothetical protein NWE57_02260 [Mycoplasmopsis cynos]